MSVRLKIEQSRDGLVATISQRDDEGKVIGDPSVSRIASKAEARRLAKTLARSLGLKVYGVVDKTKSVPHPQDPQKAAAEEAHPDADQNAPEKPSAPWLVPGVGNSF
jgi:hypothetical protein